MPRQAGRELEANSASMAVGVAEARHSMRCLRANMKFSLLLWLRMRDTQRKDYAYRSQPASESAP